jgi:NADH-quinone oxidoreductase subunit D
MVTGSRLTYSYFRFGGVCADAPPEFFDRVRAFIPRLRERMKMYKALVTDNMILLGRVDGIGPIPAEMCRRYGATGPTLRAAGVANDVRRAEPYSIYDRFDFDIPVQQSACSLGRYLVRMAEMEQSLAILEQAVESIPEGPVLPDKPARPNFKLPAGEASFAVEGARGKVKVWIASDGGKTPYRVKLRSPSLSNLSAFPEAARGTLLADAVVIIGSLDLIIPELDR